MVQSLNTKVDFTIEATSYLGIASYGKVMVDVYKRQGAEICSFLFAIFIHI